MRKQQGWGAGLILAVLALVCAGCVPPVPANQDHCGPISADETWSGPTAHHLTCDVSVLPGVTLRVASGATVDAGGGTAQLVISSGATVAVVDSSVSGIFIHTPYFPNAGACSSTTIDAVTFSADSSGFTGGGVCIGSTNLAATLTNNTFTGPGAGGVELRVGGVRTQPVVRGNSFADSQLVVNGDATGAGAAPVVKGNTFAGTAIPASFAALDDLSAITGNTATDDGGPPPVFTYSSSRVAGDWALDARTAHRDGFYGVTIASGSTTTAHDAYLVPNLLTVAGTLAVSGSTLADSPADISIDSGGSVSIADSTLTGVHLHTLFEPNSSSCTAPSSTRVGFSASHSAFSDSVVCVGGTNLSATVTGNTFDAGTVDIEANSAAAQPVVTGNTFAGSPLVVNGGGPDSGVAPTVRGNTLSGMSTPASFAGLGDLSGIFGNVATNDGGPSPKFNFAFSNVTGNWTLDPQASHGHYFFGVTIASGTTTASDAYVAGAGGAPHELTVSGGKFVAANSNFDGLGIEVHAGGTMNATGSEFSGAATAVAAVPDYSCVADWPSVTINGSIFHDNGLDIANGNKHWPRCGEAVKASGTIAALISFHPHVCVYPPSPAVPVSVSAAIKWDVEGIFPDEQCPPLWEDVTDAAHL